MLLVWVAIGLRLFQVQVVWANDLSERSLDQRLVDETLAPRRGTIYDRNGDPMALTIDAVTLYAVPSQVEDPIYVTQEVAFATGAPVEEVRADFEAAAAGGRDFVYLARQVEPVAAAQITELGLAGVYSVTEAKRVYPAEAVASQVVGLVDIDGNGAEGLELVYDEVLRGQPGTVVYERAPLPGPNGRIPQGTHELVPALPGDDLVTTIDMPLQYAALDACTQAVERTEAASCWVVALHPETGEILALTGAPAFDPVDRRAVDGSPFSNPVVRDQYEPGSVQKAITLAAALETGAVRLDTVIPQVGDSIEIVEGACRSRTDDIAGCYGDNEEHETRDMQVQEIFTISSNVGIIKIASRLPEGALDEYMQRFGLGRRTGVDFNGEATGQITVDPTCSTCLASAAIGYSVAVTPIQLAAAYGAIANDGEWVSPHLVAQRVDVDGTESAERVERRQVIDENTAWQIRQLLENVVSEDEGTGTAAAVPGYHVGGKTGTASKLLPDGTYAEDENIASFVGMAPIDDPKVVVAVVIDNPAFQYRFGGLAAAPVFAEVMESALQRLDVPPDVVAG